MVLDRMDTHPDEFIESSKQLWGEPKWAAILNNGCFNRIEKFLLKRKYRKLKRIATQQSIIQTLVYGDEKTDFVPLSTIARAAKSITVHTKDTDDTYARF